MSPTANHPSFTDTMPNHHLTPTLHPCAPISSPSTTMAPSPGPFHLLHCGHIVLITHPDRRCARNCLYAVSWANEYISNNTSPLTNTHPYSLLPFPGEPFNSVETPSTDELSSPHPPTTLYTPLPPLSTTQSHDLLHCEVCHGIPFDTFERLKLDLTNMETFQQRRTMRRALGLTRAVLKAELLLAGEEEEVVERMMCQPLRYGGRREGEVEDGGVRIGSWLSFGKKEGREKFDCHTQSMPGMYTI